MPRTVVFWQDDFPFYDALPLSQTILEAAFARAAYLELQDLPAALDDGDTDLLVLPHGSTFAFDAWPAIYRYLLRGGNLLTLAGSPFEVPVYSRRQGFSTGRPTVAYQKRLLINQSWPIDSRDLAWRPLHPSLTNIGGGWRAQRSWSLMARLCDESHYPRLGSMGLEGARLEPLVQAVAADGRVLAAPIVQLDHYHNDFAGGRWVMLNYEAEAGFNLSEEAVRLFAACERIARRGAIQLDARPAMATVAAGEPPTVLLHCRAWQEHPDAVLSLRLLDEDGATRHEATLPLPAGSVPQHLSLPLPAPLHPGLYRLHLRLRSDAGYLAQATTGYHCRDPLLARQAPAVTAGSEFLLRDGEPLIVAGTTYMAGAAHRQFLTRPNPALWEDDFAAMAAAGINFVRTGLWSGYEQVVKEPGVIREDVLRAFEAYLHSAVRHGIAVQFCFFAFQPDAFGRGNPYLDPEMISRQQDLVAAFVRRFSDVPSLSWDLINEPSQFDPSHLFRQRPLYDRHEHAAWNRWLQQRYRSSDRMLAAWNATPEDVGPWGDVRQPRVDELAYRQRWQGGKPLIANDWHLFAQDAFSDWVRRMVAAIRACGSSQPVTVGQDEGAVEGRPSPWFHGQHIDHACIHTWWLNDALLWDQLSAAVPGKPLLVQETGIMQYERLDEYSRRDEENRARLLERKFALALAAGAGFVQWLWNTNTHMSDDNEVAIGALRADGSEKPEMRCTRLMAPLAAALAPHAADSEPATVVVVQPQAPLYSVLQPLAIRATQAAVRALAYDAGVPCRVVAENGLGQIGRARLAIVPYPRALSEAGWRALLDAARRGVTVVIGGPMGDSHFHETERLAPFGIGAAVEPVTAREARQTSPGGSELRLSYAGEALNLIDRWRFDDAAATLRRFSLGSGRVLLTAYPLELNESPEALRRFYAELIDEEEARGGPLSPFVAEKAPGVLIWPRRFPRAVLYTCLSEAAEPDTVVVHDIESGVRFTLALEPERAALLLLERPSGRPIAAYVHGRLTVGDKTLWQGGDATLEWRDGRVHATTLER